MRGAHAIVALRRDTVRRSRRNAGLPEIGVGDAEGRTETGVRTGCRARLGVDAQDTGEQAGKAGIEIGPPQRGQHRAARLHLTDHSALAEHSPVMSRSRLGDLDGHGAAFAFTVPREGAHDRQPDGVAQRREHVLEAQLLTRGVVERHAPTVREQPYKPVDREPGLYESSHTFGLYGYCRTIVPRTRRVTARRHGAS